MKSSDLEYLRNWFESYVQTFTKNTGDCYPLILKKKHTFRVIKEIKSLGEKLKLTEKKLHLAQAIALLHDIGRFKQYTQYKTFIDLHSENHAELAVKIIKESKVLNRFESSVQELILGPVLYHNRAFLPSGETEQCLFLTKLLRDADKLDIYGLVSSYYQNPLPKRNITVDLGLEDTAEMSEQVLQDLVNKRIVDYRHLKNLNDFKLLQLGWVYDINFRPTFQAICERNYLKLIYVTLPQTAKLKEIFLSLTSYLDENTKEAQEIELSVK